ncbi:DNA alkylation repair protein [Actinomyces sp. zg328]|uniref:DNA alkylation repair protein n=1 Tax=Actinomyces sp. zg328 TaxID=2609287 RepID=UPI003FA4C56F
MLAGGRGQHGPAPPGASGWDGWEDDDSWAGVEPPDDAAPDPEEAIAPEDADAVAPTWEERQAEVADLVGRGRHPTTVCSPSWTDEDRRVVEDALTATGTAELADRSVDELSGGQRQRVWIAMALAQHTDVLLLDEPTTFLDLTHQVEVLDLLTDLNRLRGTTVVMVLRDINLAARYADHLVAMRDGRIAAAHPDLWCEAATWEEALRHLWDGATHREERFAVLAIIRSTRSAPHADRLESLALYEHLLRTGQWWDLVDETSHAVGLVVRAHLAAAARMRAWAVDPDLWVRRSAIICQLQHKERTDLGLLTDVIEANEEDSEFFIRKAIGWALRDYARTDGDWVRAFVETHPGLSALSRREALKHL